ncbi:hypothetical protein TA3x_005349 [Tundrisphaera sp. TA3]|uniref:hypothetical protein n=1 Tax=Tundrisphaera sp. TA3 TaxID=3435775 RepID=UPI003EBE8C47
MLEESFFDHIDPVLAPLGFLPEDGEEFRDPPLDVLRYYRRPVRLHWLPLLGRSQSVVAVARQPVDIGVAGKPGGDLAAFLGRACEAADGRFPPGRAYGWGSLGLTVVMLTPEPIGAGDDEALEKALAARRRSRAIPFGLIRVNLGQEAMAYRIIEGPGGLFPEPAALVDALTSRFRRLVPFFSGE